MNTSTLEHVVSVCRSAALMGELGPLSTGERLASALVLNRADWLAEVGYTIVEALERIGRDWRECLTAARKVLAADAAAAAAVKDALAKAAVRPQSTQAPPSTERPVTLDYEATLITCGSAGGYRDAWLVCELREVGRSESGFRAELRLRPVDAEPIVRHLVDVHQLAWRDGGPLDKQPGERRPSWIDVFTSSPLSGHTGE